MSLQRNTKRYLAGLRVFKVFSLKLNLIHYFIYWGVCMIHKLKSGDSLSELVLSLLHADSVSKSGH